MITSSDPTTPRPGAAARAFLAREHRLLIGGQWVEADTDDRIELFNPATGATLSHVPAGGTRDIGRAVAAARSAFEGERVAHGREQSGAHHAAHRRSDRGERRRAGRAGNAE